MKNFIVMLIFTCSIFSTSSVFAYYHMVSKKLYANMKIQEIEGAKRRVVSITPLDTDKDGYVDIIYE